MTMAKQRQKLGRWGERLAERYLVQQGFKVLARNWRCRLGEIDLVLRDGDTLVACEVKTRRSVEYGHPVAAVDEAKAARLSALSVVWAEEHGLARVPVRVDVVGVLLPFGEPVQIEHIRGIH